MMNNDRARPTVLVADDEESSVTVELISEMFNESVTALGASSVSQSLNLIETAARLDLIILDMNFKERGGQLGGIDILRAVKKRFPEADVLVTTGYSESLTYTDMLQMADLGVKSSCWVCKGKNDEVSILHSRISKILTQAPSTQDLETSWNACRAAGDTHSKGESLENFATLLFESMPGFRCVQKNFRLTDQEFDLILENNSNEPFWLGFRSPFIFVECKNTQSKIQADVVHGFWGKVSQHRSVARIGILLSVAGFTSGCMTTIQRLGSGELTIVLISGNNVDLMFESKTQPALWLKGQVSRSVR